MTPQEQEKPILRFQDQIALVVGGAQGIGKAISARLGREGAKVVIADIDKPMLDLTVREIVAAGAEVRPVLCDVRDSIQIDRMIAQILDWYGRIDILMYVAGIAPAMPFLETTEDVWEDTMGVNLRGAFLISKAVAPQMIQQKRGKLVFIASTNCWDAEAHLAHYNASKAGLFLLSKTLARELGPHGINSNAVGPGHIQTRLTEAVMRNEDFAGKYDLSRGLIPLGRIGTPEDAAGPALFLASEDARFVNGVLLFVDGGQLA